MASGASAGSLLPEWQLSSRCKTSGTQGQTVSGYLAGVDQSDMWTPTLDWSNELFNSLWWIAKGWAIAAVATLLILWLIGRFTKWGRQFWYVTGAYFTGRDSIKIWLWLPPVLLFVVGGVRLSVLLSYQGNDMMTSFQSVAAGLGQGDDAGKEGGKD